MRNNYDRGEDYSTVRYVAQPFLNTEELQKINFAVKSRYKDWLTYDSVQTLGGSMYLHPWSIYAKQRQLRLPEIEGLSGLYRRLGEYFSAHTPEEFNPPGFHIFDSRYSETPGQIHIDSHSRKHPIFWESRATHHPVSFTIPTQLPGAGGGLSFIGSQGEILEHLEYKPGYIYLHDGQTPHAISPSSIRKGEYRITLQGFAWVSNPGIEDIDTPYSNLIFF